MNGLYKTELIKPRAPWRGADGVEIATAEWVDWFNHRRLHSYNYDLPPVEFGSSTTLHLRPSNRLRFPFKEASGLAGAVQTV